MSAALARIVEYGEVGELGTGATSDTDVSPDVWNDVLSFYESRGHTPAWMTESDSAGAFEVLDTLRGARAHGFAAADYGEPAIAARLTALTHAPKDAPVHPEDIALLDVQLTTALLTFGREVALGRERPAPLNRREKSRRAVPDFSDTLAGAVDHPREWVEAIRPHHPEYAALTQALEGLQQQREQRAASPLLSHDDEAAVRAFQDHHGLKATGIVDEATRAALTVPLDERIRQVALNLERWRDMPDDLGPRHLFVNIPYFHLVARENGQPVLDIRVVVGKPTNKTPVFSSAMSTIVFSPYWNIPDSIVEGETVPAVTRDPAYLAKNNIEILDASGGGAVPLEYSSVDWDDPREIRRLAFRQKPGPGNALGRVKFLFPNEYDVYIHDTPADRLFSRIGRAFSHGCVRVEEPEALAKYILGDHADWDDPRILDAMAAGVEQHVRLKAPIPVHIVYFTAWVDEQGGLHFQPDVYGYDRKS